MNVEIKVIDFLIIVVYEYNLFIIILYVYFVEYVFGEFKLNEYLDIKFLMKEEMVDYDFVVVDLLIIEKL